MKPDRKAVVVMPMIDDPETLFRAAEMLLCDPGVAGLWIVSVRNPAADPAARRNLRALSPRLRIVEAAQRTLNAATNDICRTARTAGFDTMVRLTPGSGCAPGWVSRLLCLMRHAECSALVTLQSQTGQLRPSRLRKGRSVGFSPYLERADMACDLDVFCELGGFDADYKGCETFELLVRALEQGYPVWTVPAPAPVRRQAERIKHAGVPRRRLLALAGIALGAGLWMMSGSPERKAALLVPIWALWHLRGFPALRHGVLRLCVNLRARASGRRHQYPVPRRTTPTVRKRIHRSCAKPSRAT